MAKRSHSIYRWRRAVFRWGIWNICYRFWFKIHIEGWENIPADQPTILMGNHIAAIDPGIMISLYPDRDIVPLAKIEAFNQPVLRYFVRHWGAIAVERGEADLSALKAAFKHIDDGDIVMLYVEGTRSKTGLIEGQEGTAYLGLKSNAVIVPVAIWGTNEMKDAWFKWFRRPRIYMRFGCPFKFKKEGRKLPREHFRAMTDEAMYQLAALLPEEWRGIYSDLSKATTKFLDFDLDWNPVSERLPRRVAFPAELSQRILVS